MNVWGLTHRGAVRMQNQDSFTTQTLPDGRVIALVCDGMGGARAGNVASSMAVAVFMEEFLDSSGAGEERMIRAADRANREIFQHALDEPECSGMGTTLVAALAGEEEAVILNEGDSRAYHIGAEGIVRVTRDHSVVEDLVERGELTREEARTHPHKNLITRALGADAELMADVFRRPLSPGDSLLLCSDGLSNLLSEEELLAQVTAPEPDTCCDRLLRLALDRGAPDNVTAVLIRR